MMMMELLWNFFFTYKQAVIVKLSNDCSSGLHSHTEFEFIF